MKKVTNTNKKAISTNKIRFIDLFAGLGGFRIALENSGAECVFSSEWDKYAGLTYQHNFKEFPNGDITKIVANQVPKHNIICAGFPCQAFSISGKQLGFDDTRGTLFFDIARIAMHHKPEVLFLENVKNLGRHNNGHTLKRILSVLEEIGYDPYYKVLNASLYGVPQSRERIYIVAFNKRLKINNFSFPEPTLEKVSVGDILEKGIDEKNFIIDRKDITIRNDKNKNHLGLFEEIPYKPLRVGTINKGGQGERIYSPLGHAITLSAYGGGAAGKTGAYFINGKVRQLSPRECLRVQGFPDSYEFPSTISVSQAYKMCGNSVSVPVIEKIFASISSFLPTK
jgi:DNA (cytosine-5)-methyltransferase 1